jgi:aspartyl-tRNA(Asn)/glutamyl-tRNA(Gln) amidotransferase subunit B
MVYYSKKMWETVIGLEVHAQVISESKLFSSSSTEFGAMPNSQVSLFDAALPGTLPSINEHIIEQAVKTGLAVEAKINMHSSFDRKGYFYPDLPAGYQITQFFKPIALGGRINIGNGRTIKLERIHIEQDAGKCIHDISPRYSYIDLNRAGVALMEIVSAPEIRSPQEAAAYIKKLRNVLRYIGTCDGDMENGSLRCDANISIRKVGDQNFGTRCEIKNLNSIKNIVKALEYEAARHIKLIERGEMISQETRLFDAGKCITKLLRKKEGVEDYRYFPEPDLPPVIISKEFIDSISLPELPDQKEKRYVQEFGLSEYDTSVIVANKAAASYFEQIASSCDPKLAASWITVELFGCLKKQNLDIKNSPIGPERLIGLIKFIEAGEISGKIAKEIFAEMFSSKKTAQEIINKRGLKQINSMEEISGIIKQILENNTEEVMQYKQGKEKLFGFFMGQVMKATSGKANPKLTNDILQEILKN